MELSHGVEAMAETASFVEERRMFQVPDVCLKRAGPVEDRLRMSHTPPPAGLQVCWTFKF